MGSFKYRDVEQRVLWIYCLCRIMIPREEV